MFTESECGERVRQTVISLPFVWFKLKINPINHVNIEITVWPCENANSQLLFIQSKSLEKINMMLPSQARSCISVCELQIVRQWQHLSTHVSAQVCHMCVWVGAGKGRMLKIQKFIEKAKGNMWECKSTSGTTGKYCVVWIKVIIINSIKRNMYGSNRNGC